jgi:NifU-like protein involved in Fe-S cluster formation
MDNTDALVLHYQNPKNPGKFFSSEQELRVLTGESHLELYNDSLSLKFKWVLLPCPQCSTTGKVPNAASGGSDIEFVNCSYCLAFGSYYYIESVRYLSKGCGWLMASASWFSEYAECQLVSDVLALKEEDVIRLSGLPWAAHHCALLIREATLGAFRQGFSCFIDPAYLK